VIRVAAAPTVFLPLIEGTATIGALFTADVIGSDWPPRMANRVGWVHPVAYVEFGPLGLGVRGANGDSGSMPSG